LGRIKNPFPGVKFRSIAVSQIFNPRAEGQTEHEFIPGLGDGARQRF